jgi:uncharacterized protein with GYD domain
MPAAGTSWAKKIEPTCRVCSSKEGIMAKYLIEGRYTTEGAKAIGREGGSARRATAAKMIESVGGKLEAFYFAFGDVDVYAIIDLPDTVAAAAVALAINQTGVVAGKTVVLIPPEDMDKAVKKAVDYRPAGR